MVGNGSPIPPSGPAAPGLGSLEGASAASLHCGPVRRYHHPCSSFSETAPAPQLKPHFLAGRLFRELKEEKNSK